MAREYYKVILKSGKRITVSKYLGPNNTITFKVKKFLEKMPEKLIKEETLLNLLIIKYPNDTNYGQGLVVKKADERLSLHEALGNHLWALPRIFAYYKLNGITELDYKTFVRVLYSVYNPENIYITKNDKRIRLSDLPFTEEQKNAVIRIAMEVGSNEIKYHVLSLKLAKRNEIINTRKHRSSVVY